MSDERYADNTLKHAPADDATMRRAGVTQDDTASTAFEKVYGMESRQRMEDSFAPVPVASTPPLSLQMSEREARFWKAIFGPFFTRKSFIVYGAIIAYWLCWHRLGEYFTIDILNWALRLFGFAVITYVAIRLVQGDSKRLVAMAKEKARLQAEKDARW
jgi:hypothetical protein